MIYHMVNMLLKRIILFKNSFKKINGSQLLRNVHKHPEKYVDIELNSETIASLEKLSLITVDNNKTLYKMLRNYIALGEEIVFVNTDNVEPLITVLEDTPLVVREDEVKEGEIRDKVIANSSLTEEEYFVGPPGNIPLEQSHILDEEFIAKK